MAGNKWRYVCLQLHFIGWMLLAMLTCGVGLLWVFPYYQASVARFYDEAAGGSSGTA